MRLPWANYRQDICILRVERQKFNPVRLRPSYTLKIGEKVYNIANPAGNGKYMSRGHIIDIRHDGSSTWVLSNVVSVKGSSGGGLFDTRGNLIGLTTKYLKRDPRVSYSASVDSILRLLYKSKPIPATTHPPQPHLPRQK